MKKAPIILVTLTILFSFSFSIRDNYILPYKKKDFVKVQRDFGYKYIPILCPKKFNAGIVFQLKNEAKIYSIHDGTVINLCDTCYRGLGNRVEILHNDSIIVTYYHLSQITTSKGKTVSKGEKIGVSGNSGLVTENGLGIMMKLNDSLINPRKLIHNWY